MPEIMTAMETEEPAETGKIAPPDWNKQILKFSLIGLLGGMFLMCLWFAFRYIQNNLLVDYKDIEQKGILLKELGTLPNQDYSMVAANIRAFGGEKEKLFLTGLADEGLFKNTCDGIKDYLDDYDLIPARDALHDSKAREKVVGCDAAILIEQKNVSRYSEMKEEITFLVNAEKEIIGIVIV